MSDGHFQKPQIVVEEVNEAPTSRTEAEVSPKMLVVDEFEDTSLVSPAPEPSDTPEDNQQFRAAKRASRMAGLCVHWR